jgi:hypothetical protein
MKILWSLFSLITVLTAAPCVFDATPLTQGLSWTTTTSSKVIDCFNSVPFSSAVAGVTISQLRNLASLYSFVDISVASPPPYSLAVNLNAGLTAIGANTYQSDFKFQIGLYNLFNGLGDAHTLYFLPNPYNNFYLVRPMFFTSTMQNGKQVIMTTSEVIKITSTT